MGLPVGFGCQGRRRTPSSLASDGYPGATGKFRDQLLLTCVLPTAPKFCDLVCSLEASRLHHPDLIGSSFNIVHRPTADSLFQFIRVQSRCPKSTRKSAKSLKLFGAGEGNRTLVFSLEGCCSTIELHPRAGDHLSRQAGGLNRQAAGRPS
jgi:hypothetical protein